MKSRRVRCGRLLWNKTTSPSLRQLLELTFPYKQPIFILIQTMFNERAFLFGLGMVFLTWIPIQLLCIFSLTPKDISNGAWVNRETPFISTGEKFMVLIKKGK